MFRTCVVHAAVGNHYHKSNCGTKRGETTYWELQKTGQLIMIAMASDGICDLEERKNLVLYAQTGLAHGITE